MFGRIAFGFRSIKSYLQYDESCRQQHVAEAMRLFPIEALELTLADAQAVLQADCRSALCDEIDRSHARLSQSWSTISRLQSDLRAAHRDFKLEIDAHYMRKQALFNQRAPLYEKKELIQAQINAAMEEKDEAYEQVNEATDDINAWHRKSSRSFFGNAGKKIPHHNLFGQSMNDLYRDQRDRREAFEDIEGIRETISELFADKRALQEQIRSLSQQIAQANSAIAQTKTEREAARQVKLDKAVLHQKTVDLNSLWIERKTLSDRIAALSAERDAFLTEQSRLRGIDSLMTQVEAMRKECKAYIASFSDKEAIDRRLTEHAAIRKKEYQAEQHEKHYRAKLERDAKQDAELAKKAAKRGRSGWFGK